MNKTLTSIIASAMLVSPALANPQFPEFKEKDLVETKLYIPMVHGVKMVWGRFKLYDLDKTDKFDWDWAMYFIQCSYTINPPKSPFLIYDRLNNRLHQFDVNTGKYEGMIPGFIAPLNYVQPKCPYDIKVDDIKIKLEL